MTGLPLAFVQEGKKVTVSEVRAGPGMLRRLSSMGLHPSSLVEVVLTPRGRQIAEVIKFRHDTLKRFFLLIDVPEETADKDACTMEHELSEKSIEQIRLFIEYLDSTPSRQELVKDFSACCRSRPKR